MLEEDWSQIRTRKIRGDLGIALASPPIFSLTLNPVPLILFILPPSPSQP